MFSAIRESILAPPPPKPVKQQDHRSNTWAVLPQTAPIRYRLLTGYPQRAPKQMGWFTFYSLSSSQALLFHCLYPFPNKQPTFPLFFWTTDWLTLCTYLVVMIQLPRYFLSWSTVVFSHWFHFIIYCVLLFLTLLFYKHHQRTAWATSKPDLSQQCALAAQGPTASWGAPDPALLLGKGRGCPLCSAQPHLMHCVQVWVLQCKKDRKLFEST